MRVQFIKPVVKLACTVGDLSGTVVYGRRAIFQFLGTFRQLIHTGNKFFGLGKKRIQSVIQFRRTVDQLTHRVSQILKRPVQIQIRIRRDLIGVELIQKLRRCDCHGHTEAEVHAVRADLDRVRDRDLIRRKSEVFRKAREREAHDDRSASVVDQFAV